MDETRAEISPEKAAEQNEYDIFLSTRELPDQLTAETAALRQLCSALSGEGYRVFFPSALPKELTDEERARRIVDALKSARVMVLAGVGEEGLADPVTEKLRGVFAERGGTKGLITCWRDVDADRLREVFGETEILDMSDLRFLVTLKDRLSELLPPAEEAAAETEPAEEAGPDAEEEPAKEAESAEEAGSAGEAGAAAAKKPFPWKWVLLGAAVAAVVLWLVLR